MDTEAFDHFKRLQEYEQKLGAEKMKELLGLVRKPSAPIFKTATPDQLIFPGYFLPVIIWQDQTRRIVPMRYRIRPAGTKKEIPTKFNLYNARVDGLETRRLWHPLFLKHHGIIPFKKFLEHSHKKFLEESMTKSRTHLFSFKPLLSSVSKEVIESKEIMWGACLWDEWKSSQMEDFHFKSCALITDDPPASVQESGIDRAPIFLPNDCMDTWLTIPFKKTNFAEKKESIYQILSQRFEPVLQYSLYS